MLWIDSDDALEDRVEAFYAKLAASSVAAVRSPYSVLAHRRVPPWRGGAHTLRTATWCG